MIKLLFKTFLLPFAVRACAKALGLQYLPNHLSVDLCCIAIVPLHLLYIHEHLGMDAAQLVETCTLLQSIKAKAGS